MTIHSFPAYMLCKLSEQSLSHKSELSIDYRDQSLLTSKCLKSVQFKCMEAWSVRERKINRSKGRT